MQILLRRKTFARSACWVFLLLALFASHALAQSTDVAWPSPIRTNEVTGTIVARDLGDPRLTDHYYAFTGTPGDVLITIDSKNLNGDIDVFTFSGLRPLLKFTVYAGTSSAITKGIYLRNQEDLILRVEGRTPNDDEAVYRIRFAGTFAPITSGPLAEHEDALQPTIATTASVKGGRRVSSVGARIEEPKTEVAEAPKPEPTPAESPEPGVATPKPRARTNRPRRPVAKRTHPPAPAKTEETVAKSEAENKPPSDNSEAVIKKPATPKRAARGAATRSVPKQTAVHEPENTGPRLVIETSDGMLIDRYMTSVRRVTVENGQVIVVGKDGKIQRVPLASVVRMTISP